MAIKTVGVLGCGLMGSGIAQVCAAAGYTTIVREVEQGVLDKGLGRVNKFLSDGVEKGKVTPEAREKTLANLSGTTQFASVTAVSSQSQDGYASGEFSGLAIDGTGLVQGLYTNGQKITIGQLAVAKFRSNDGLGRAGQNLWIETRDSGTAALGAAGAGGRASVTAGALESSNVDLGEEFVGLIQHQRSFSANSRTITTADEMLQELINIKR